MTQNDDFAKISKIDFSIMDVDMNTGVGPHENTSFGCVLTYLSPIHHPHSKKAPCICHSRQKSFFYPIFGINPKNPHFGQHLLTKIFVGNYSPKRALKDPYFRIFISLILLEISYFKVSFAEDAVFK